MAGECEICVRETAGTEPAGGWVLRTSHWSVCVAAGFEVPGWLFVELRRHAEGPWSMDAAEAGELGVVLAQVSGAVQAATGAERVYIVAFGELFPHFHLLVHPRLPGAPPEERGASLFGQRDRLIDAAKAIETAAAVRDALERQDVAED